MSLVTCQNGLLFSRLSSCLSAVSCLFTLAGNGLGIGEEGEFENLQSNICTKVDSSTTDQLLPSAPFLPIPCYLLPCFVSLNLLLVLELALNL